MVLSHTTGMMAMLSVQLRHYTISNTSALPCHLVDDGGKVCRAVELHSPEALEVRLQHPFNAHTVGILAVTILQK